MTNVAVAGQHVGAATPGSHERVPREPCPASQLQEPGPAPTYLAKAHKIPAHLSPAALPHGIEHGGEAGHRLPNQAATMIGGERQQAGPRGQHLQVG